MNKYADAVSRIDIARSRKIGEMLVSETREFVDPKKIYELAAEPPEKLLTRYLEKQKNFDTAPFDPEGKLLKFFDGGYTVWSGYPGAGKSTLLRQLCLHLLHRKKSVFYVSLEEDPGDLLIRLCSVAFGIELPTKDQLEWLIDYYCDTLRLWGVIGIADHRELFGAIEMLAEQGTKHIVLDSLMCLDVASDNFEQQRKFANLLSALVRKNNIHVHLVAHPRKIISTEQEPDINDVAGSADIGRLADNVLFVRRGKVSGQYNTFTPMQILIKKQRHGTGQIGEVTGIFHKSINQFKNDQYDTVPTRYLPDAAYGEFDFVDQPRNAVPEIRDRWTPPK